MEKQAHLKWVDNLQFVGQTPNGQSVVMDGNGNGFSPMEMLLLGTAGCTAMDVVSILQKKRVKVSGFEIHITGQRAEEHPKRYTHIHVEYIVYGTDVKPTDVERSIELSETKYCSAMASLNAQISHSYRIEKTPST